MTEEVRSILLDIFENTERLDKIRVTVEPVSKTLRVEYEDIDEQWFEEITDALRKP